MIRLNYRDAKPIYEQVKDGIKRLIVTNYLEADERLPAVGELASRLAINPNAILAAYQELEAEGYLYTRSGNGTFVTAHQEENCRKEELLHAFDDIVLELIFLSMEPEELQERVGRLDEKRGKT